MLVAGLLTLGSSELAPRSRSGSLNRRVVPSRVTFKVTRVSGVLATADAMMMVICYCKENISMTTELMMWKT